MLVRLLTATLILLCFELGFVLLIIAWTPYWQYNYFLDRWPVIAPWLTSFYVRGAVSGLGLVDIGIASGFLMRFGEMASRLDGWLNRVEASGASASNEGNPAENQ